VPSERLIEVGVVVDIWSDGGAGSLIRPIGGFSGGDLIWDGTGRSLIRLRGMAIALPLFAMCPPCGSLRSASW
jgi:hypothetical protein